jgi:hypothetical protein
MDNKAALLEAVKRKRALIQYQKEDPDVNSQSKDEDNEDLAPAGANKASEHDALLGTPDGKNSSEPAESSSDADNQTALGKEQGFDRESHESPANSKNLFLDPKKDTHDPVDLNKHRDMAGREGERNQNDDMGVDVHQDVRRQSSKLAGKNAVRAEGLKNSFRNDVKGKMDLSSKMASSDGDAGKDAPDAAAAINPDNPGKLTGMKSARAKLDGFLSKMKTNKSW